MPALRLTSDRYLAAPDMDRLRTRANDLSRAEDWAGLHALRPELERDSDMWPDWWGPLCALAARKVADPGAMDLLAALAQAGFGQLEIFGGEIEAAFAGDPRWQAVLHRIEHNAPPSPLILTDWPVLTPAAPLGLLDLPGQAEELRALVPAAAGTAWQTAVATLGWVTSRWTHADAHMEIDDAVECLRRVDAGQRFACVEYSLVLTQALNALAIPARRLALRQQDYHVGVGRGHVVSEAWIDEKCRWVVLDGQNGMYWTGADGEPLGAVELQQAALSGAPRPRHVTTRDDVSDADADVWYSYFSHVSSTAGTWAAEPFGVVFQRNRLAMSGRLEHRPDALYPDLSGIGVETALDGDQPALRLSAAHPYARGFTAAGEPLTDGLLPLPLSPGDHELELAVRTDYGVLPGKPLCYRVTLPPANS